MKVYSEEFKADAVALYLSDPTATYASVTKDLGAGRETLRLWVKQARQAKAGERRPERRQCPKGSTPKEHPYPCNITSKGCCCRSPKSHWAEKLCHLIRPADTRGAVRRVDPAGRHSRSCILGPTPP
ncbi:MULTISPECIES: transposase [Actinomadura]|uniref:Transposase n=1 Tax=Actinomadura yumaensis TaxID=111807 RepID=A0ABW2CLF3_9ACTN|nr:transposase [Actinomadura sp. J1-007]MWK37173.1 transposase [Actinomadura sp. J1-007]